MHDTLARIRGLAVLAGVWLRATEMEISAEVREAVAHLRWCAYTSPRLLTYLRERKQPVLWIVI